MIYFLSDLHGWYESKDFAEYLTQPHEKDLLIVLGDTQLGFPNNEEFTKRFLSTKNPIALVDGNHENHDFLFSCPTEEWNGGIVNRLSENVVYLRRGNIYKQFCWSGQSPVRGRVIHTSSNRLRRQKRQSQDISRARKSWIANNNCCPEPIRL